MSDSTVHTAGECSIKTENHSVSRDFQHFLDSAAIELDVFNYFIFNLSLLRCSRLRLFYVPCSSASKCSVELASL